MARPASPNTPPLATAEIRVLRDGHPAPHARVECTLSPQDGADSSAGGVQLHEADDSGRLVLELAPGTLRVAAWDTDATAPPAKAALEPGQRTSVELALAPAWPVAGRVIDARSGRPLAGAEVSFWTFAERDVVVTGPDGTFEHPRFPADAPAQQVHARAAGHGRAVRYLRIARDGSWKLPAATAAETASTGKGVPWLEIALVPEVTLRGRVVDPSGAPLAGALVRAEGYFHALPSVAARDGADATTDADGRFAITGLRSDLGHALAIEAAGYASRALEIEATADGARELGDLALELESALAGVVIDGDGVPLADVEVVLEVLERERVDPGDALDAGARVQSRERRTRTDEGGNFVFAGLGRESVRVRALGPSDTAVEELLPPRADGSFAAPTLVLATLDKPVVAAQAPR